MFSENDPRTQKEEGSTNIVQKVIGFLGVPGFILNTFGPQILQQARRNPRLFKIVTPIIFALSAFAALTHLVWPLFNSVVGEWLPFARLKSDDPLYDYLCRWVHYRRDPLRHLEIDAQSAAYRRQQSHDKLWWPEDHVGDKDICYEKSGKRFFWFKRTLFILETIAWSGRRSYYNDSKDVKLKALSFSHQPLKDVLREAWLTYQAEEGSRTTRIWHVPEDCWEVLSYKNIRPLDTVDVEEVEKNKLMKDLAKYLSDDTKSWYSRRGIPYRRGYLFHGPPGTGKTSLSMAIAGHFNIDLYVLSLANPRLNDGLLTNLMTSVDEPCVVLLEDIDSAGLSREISSTIVNKPVLGPAPQEDDDQKGHDKMGRLTERVERCNITLSGVLNALDGAASPEGHILIMSTNAPEALDPALARAGRVDYKVGFKNADYETARNIYKRMIGTEGEGAVDAEKLEELAGIFAGKVPEGRFSPAELQGYLLNYIDEVDNAMDDLNAWVKKALGEKEEREKAEAEKKAGKKAINDGTIETSGDNPKVDSTSNTTAKATAGDCTAGPDSSASS